MIDGLPPMAPQQREMVVCAIGAGLAYGVPVNIMLAVAEQESGKAGQWVRNTNGTYDVGTMQFNTSYLRELQRYGITPQAVAQPGCYPYQLAAWRLRGHLKDDTGDIWTRAANYHSRTPYYNARYRYQLIYRAKTWTHWLNTHFSTHMVDSNSPLSAPANG